MGAVRSWPGFAGAGATWAAGCRWGRAWMAAIARAAAASARTALIHKPSAMPLVRSVPVGVERVRSSGHWAATMVPMTAMPRDSPIRREAFRAALAAPL